MAKLQKFRASLHAGPHDTDGASEGSSTEPVVRTAGRFAGRVGHRVCVEVGAGGGEHVGIGESRWGWMR